MKRVFQFALVAILAAEALVIGQGSEAARILNEMRAALGGEKLTAVKNFTATAKSARSAGQFQLTGDLEIFCELPDKYVRKEQLTIGGGMASTSSTLGFNGNTLLRESSAPGTMASHGGVVMFRGGGGPAGGPPPTPEQQAAMDANFLRSAKTDFTRLTVALLGSSFTGNPVEFSYAGQAEAPEGKADILDVKGQHDFAAKLFVDGRTHMPLMMSWQAPGVMLTTSSTRMTAPGGAPMVVGRGGGTVTTQSSGGQQMSEDRMKEMMDAAQKLVEHRWYFSEYREVDGVKLPFRIVRSVDGNTTEELTFEKFKLNTRIDEKKFR